MGTKIYIYDTLHSQEIPLHIFMLFALLGDKIMVHALMFGEST